MGRKTYKKIITSPELINQINPVNKKLVERFLKNYRTKRSSRSADSYESNYNIFFCWNIVYNNNKSFIDLKKLELMDFFDYAVNELKWSPNRYSQVWSSLSVLSDFIENILDEQYPNFRNIVKKIGKLEKEPVRKKSIFTKEEMDNLMLWLDENQHVQEQCLLSLMLSSGARVSELNRFDINIIDLNNTAFDGLFLETTEEMQVKGRGTSGKKIRRYIIKDMFVPNYLKWLPLRDEIMKRNNQDHNCLFIKKDGTPAEVSTLRSWMDKWDKQLEKPWYPHAARHYWCTSCLSMGLENSLVQELQNWQSDSMVRIYDDSTAKDKKWKGLEKFKANLAGEEVKSVDEDNSISDSNQSNNSSSFKSKRF